MAPKAALYMAFFAIQYHEFGVANLVFNVRFVNLRISANLAERRFSKKSNNLGYPAARASSDVKSLVMSATSSNACAVP